MALLVAFINIFAISSIVFYWHKRLSPSPIRTFFLPALLFKVGAGLLLGLIYRFYYHGGDTFVYFEDAEILANLAYQSPISYLKAWTGSPLAMLNYADQPRALAIVKIISIPAIITFKNYWITSIYLSLFSFFGMWKLAVFLSSVQENFKYPAVAAFLFYPSVIYWSAGVLKEPVIMGCLSICLVIYLPYVLKQERLRFFQFLLSLLLMFIIWQLKFYYAAVFVPLLFAIVFNTYIKNISVRYRNSLTLQFMLTIFVPLLSYFFMSGINPMLSFENLFAEILKNHDWYLVNGALPLEGHIHYSELKPDIISFIKNAPLALFSGLFRPLVFDAHNLLQTLAGMENTLLLILFAAALLKVYKLKRSRHIYLFLITVIYVVLLATLLAIAAPNFGTLMRYKIAFLPFLVFLILVNNPLLHILKTGISGLRHREEKNALFSS